jgi:hypothetical protein
MLWKSSGILSPELVRGDELQIPHSVRDDKIKNLMKLKFYSYLSASAGKIRAADQDG